MIKPKIEAWLEAGLFASRWLLAPLYVGLVLALVVVLAVFVTELWRGATGLIHIEPDKLGLSAIIMALGLIDLSLLANLLLIVIFSGYENFVSKINTENHEDRPDWMGTVDFSALKLKLIASIVAISAISLLRTFLELGSEPFNSTLIMWQVLIHLTFVASGVMLALMDFISSKAQPMER
jgi:uncharacterized protein (TIGR00645 family)